MGARATRRPPRPASALSPTGRPAVPTAGLRAPAGLTGDLAVTWVASRQHGVVAGEQLVGCGLSASAIKHRVHRGRLIRLHRGVFAVGHDAISPQGRILAAVLAAGPGALASHMSAAVLHRITPAGGPRDVGLRPVDVTITGGRSPRHRDGLRRHVTGALDPRDLRWVGPIPTTSPARTALDVAAWAGERAGERVLAGALQQRISSLSEVRSLLSRSYGHHGVGALSRIVDLGPRFDHSVAERLLLELVRRARLLEPRTNVRVVGFEVDALWSGLRVVAEFDSVEFHGDLLAFRRDRRKSAALQAAGYDVVPVVWTDLVDAPESVAATIASVLAVARVRTG